MKKPCRKSGKIKFDSHEQAAVRAGEILMDDFSINALGTYICKHCNKWHLTSFLYNKKKNGFNMKPNKEGIFEWFDKNGTKRLVMVFNVMKKCPNVEPYFRVYWEGGYYNVNDEHDAEHPEYDIYTEAEWVGGTWGNYVGEIGSVKEEDLYIKMTPEERIEFESKSI